MPNQVGRNEYIEYLWHDGSASTFCIEPPNHGVPEGGTGNALFSFTVMNEVGHVDWRHEELLNFQGLDHKSWQATLKLDNQGNPYLHGRFYCNIAGMDPNHGEFPIFLDPRGKPWRLKTVLITNAAPRGIIILEEFK